MCRVCFLFGYIFESSNLNAHISEPRRVLREIHTKLKRDNTFCCEGRTLQKSTDNLLHNEDNATLTNICMKKPAIRHPNVSEMAIKFSLEFSLI